MFKTITGYMGSSSPTRAMLPSIYYIYDYICIIHIKLYIYMPGIVAQVCNAGTQETEARRSQVQDSMGYIIYTVKFSL